MFPLMLTAFPSLNIQKKKTTPVVLRSRISPSAFTTVLSPNIFQVKPGGAVPQDQSHQPFPSGENSPRNVSLTVRRQRTHSAVTSISLRGENALFRRAARRTQRCTVIGQSAKPSGQRTPGNAWLQDGRLHLKEDQRSRLHSRVKSASDPACTSQRRSSASGPPACFNRAQSLKACWVIRQGGTKGYG